MKTTLLLCLLTLGAVGQTLTGAGSTFIYPIMSRWAAAYEQAHPGVSINYQSIGSGAGIEQVRNRTVDFGASDAALTDEQLKTMPPVIQIAESAGPVCIIYNVPGLRAPLRLTGAALAGIYLGQIRYWDAAPLAAANPGVHLPHVPVLVTHRSDGSGTTAIFTSYLAKVSPEWRQRTGAGLAVRWPVGLGGKGSEGVSGLVKQMRGTIGYVELSYATTNHLGTAQIENAAGHFITASADSATAALAASAKVLERDLRTPITNAPGAASYPITGLTFLILPKNAANAGNQRALRQFVTWVLTHGQSQARALGYAPLPPAVVRVDLEALKG
ncbi:MAG: phosphate ABC transporter substrate-binding protein PstS [Acidobacteria bacterium]|nr:MAG: phosphate ABC transporter substrate-binding protein PstS [Acidobacteriota bacterium]